MCAANKKSIAIGIEDFRDMIDQNCYFVDKTLMIRDLLDSDYMVTLFTRPRRFGKTLNMSMLRRFFEDERKPDGTPMDNRYLFDDLAISKCGEEYLKHQQQYPVISLSLKSAKQSSYEQAYEALKKAIAEEYERHSYVLLWEGLPSWDKRNFEQILQMADAPCLYLNALQRLSSTLKKYYGRKCIILIDEYDVVLENAWRCGFYYKLIPFIESLFESALKTNDSLEFGILTGCLRISRESMFSGLNNLVYKSVIGAGYSNAFGFTETEVKELFAYYGIENHFEKAKAWYGGYVFGASEMYNPWSLLCYIDGTSKGETCTPEMYWVSTSSSAVIGEIIEKADIYMRNEIEALLAGKILLKRLNEQITYEDIHESGDNLWNFLYFTGYLTSAGQVFKDQRVYVRMEIPNTEVKTIYKDTVLRWFDRKLEGSDLRPLMKAFEEGDCVTIGDIISDELMDTISFFDYGESYYHGFLAGLLRAAGGYEILSNRETGLGRTDIVMREPKFRGKAIILELKIANSFDEMEQKCHEALAQIDERKYEEGLRREGCREILKYGLCFLKKGCIAIKAE